MDKLSNDVMVITGTNIDEFQAEAAELKVQGYISKHYASYFDTELKSWNMVAVFEKESAKPNLCDTCAMYLVCDMSSNNVSSCISYFKSNESEANK